jgi:hypothetical protein
MKNLILILALVATNHIIVFSQGCLPEGIIFETQEQIDNFQTNYPGCTEIEGDLKINGYFDVSNLSGLYVIEKIDGDLSINHNYSLQNLQGLNSLTEIQGSLMIDHNNGLLNFSGMESLNIIGDHVYLIQNIGLENCNGFENIVAIPGLLGISNNSELMNLSGFNNLEEVGYLLIIESNPILHSLEGFNNINNIGEDLIIENNASLEDITALSGLKSIGDYLHIKGNNSLTNLFGLDSIQLNSINDLTIIENALLQDCDIYSICQYLIGPTGNIEIHDNAPGCNSQEEVEAACLTGVEEIIITAEITLFPNPATSFITINVTGGQPIVEAIIYNHLGQKALEAVPVNNTVDVSMLTPGIYFIEVATKDWRGRTKLVKQ